MKKIFGLLVLIFLGIVILLPVIWLFFIAFKSRLTIFETPPSLFGGLHFNNFIEILSDSRFLNAIKNSTIITLSSTSISILISTIAAYSLSRNARNNFKNNIFNLMLALLILPPVVIILPLYIVHNRIGITGTLFSIILAHIGILVPFGILLLTSFFKKVSIRIEEVSRIHAISFKKFFLEIFFYEVRGAIIITWFLMILMSWNEFLFSMILTNTNTQTLPVLIEGLVTPIGTFWGKIASISFIASIPVLILGILFRNALVTGFTFGFINIK